MASFTSADLNPIDFANEWQNFYLNGTPNPGVVIIGGVQGWERKNGWEIKKGKGQQGAVLTLSTLPPAQGSFTVALWLPRHFTLWGDFVQIMKYDPLKNKTKAANALTIEYPSLSDLSIFQVVTESIGPVIYQGRGLYTSTVSFIEWAPPPAKSVVETTNKAGVDDKNNTPGLPPDTALDAQKESTLNAMRAANWADPDPANRH